MVDKFFQYHGIIKANQNNAFEQSTQYDEYLIVHKQSCM